MCGYTTMSGGNFIVKNLLTNLIPTLGWWDWTLEKVGQAGQICSILLLLQWVGSMLVRVIQACTDSRNYNIPIGTALHINILLEDRLRNLLCEEARGIPQPAGILLAMEDSPL